ncbi:iron-sulfur cluster repair di-iron protein [soil metagenome]
MLIQKENKIGEVVASNFRTAEVFEKLGLDFCCGGKKTIENACLEKALNTESVLNELSKVTERSAGGQHFETWEPDFLIDYIVSNHHAYVINSASSIAHHMDKVVLAHGIRHPELSEIRSIFNSLREELLSHMQKEEKMLFPFIKKMMMAKNNSFEMTSAPFGAIENPLGVMESEHQLAGKMMDEISIMSSNFTPPANACGTYKVVFQELKEFETDLHLHIHLENNILFPKAIKIANELKTSSGITDNRI